MIEFVVRLWVSNCKVFKEEILDTIIKSFCDIYNEVTIVKKSALSLLCGFNLNKMSKLGQW